MRLHLLTLRNFRNVEYAELPLGGATLLVGLNGQGKSTIHNAIQMCLHGWCEHTDKRGAGYQQLIRDGEREAHVQLDLSHGDRCLSVCLTLGKSRQWSCIDTVSGAEVSGIDSPAALWLALGINQQHAVVTMFPTVIVNAPEFSGVLADYLGGALTVDGLASYMGEHADALRAVATAHHIPLTRVVDFDTLGKICYDQRTVVNRDLKVVQAALAEAPFLKPVMDGGARLGIDDIARLEAEHADLTTKLHKLHEQRGAASVAPSGPVADVATLESDVQRISDDLYRAQQYEAAMGAVADAQRLTAATCSRIVEAQAFAPKDCPTCGGKLSKAKRDAMIAERVAAAQAEHDAAADAETRAREHLESLPPAEFAAALSALLAEARAEVTAARRMPPPYTGPSLLELDAEIATAVARQSAAVDMLTQLRQHAQHAAAEAEAAALTARRAVLDHGVKMYHDGVASRELLSAAAAPLVEAVNQRIAGTLGIAADGKAFALTWNGRPLARASRGQRASVAYAMAEAFAACGAPILLDDTNDLDPLARGRMCARLRGHDCVVLAGTPNSVDGDYVARLAEMLKPMHVVRVDSGTYTTELAATAAIEG